MVFHSSKNAGISVFSVLSLFIIEQHLLSLSLSGIEFCPLAWIVFFFFSPWTHTHHIHTHTCHHHCANYFLVVAAVMASADFIFVVDMTERFFMRCQAIVY